MASLKRGGKKLMIVDFHAHIGLSKTFGNRYADSRALIEIMDGAGIDKAVLIPTASSVKTIPSSSQS